MHRSDRLTGIMIALQGGSRTAASLAARFEVSRRTIMRDIDALGELGVPVISEAGRLGGYKIADGFWLPPMHLTADEATVLLFALEHVGDAERSPLGEAHTAVLEKIRAVLSPAVSPDVNRNLQTMRVVRDHDAPDPHVIAALRRALESSEWLAMTYFNASGETERAILPMRIYTSGGRWYMDAADSLREESRVFRISRIASVRRTLAPENAANTLQALEASGKSYHHPDNPLIEVHLTKRGVELAADHPDFRNHLDGAQISFRCPVEELPYYGRELLRFGTDARVVGPPALLAWITTTIRELLLHHEGCS